MKPLIFLWVVCIFKGHKWSSWYRNKELPFIDSCECERCGQILQHLRSIGCTADFKIDTKKD
jgi:hypothetical protein